MSVSDPSAPIPVTVLTGFLGSGKTTTLARCLKAPEFEGTVAIINEFGEIGLDHLLIEASEERFALLDNGCVCCTVRDDLVETLLGLVARVKAGALPDFRRVVIETTGLADPAPILHALIAEERIQRAYRIDGVLATVDAVNGLATLAAHPEAVKQVAIADRILLTKADIATGNAIERLRARLLALNPYAEVIESRHGDAPAAALVGVELQAKRNEREVARWFDRAERANGFRFRAEDAEACRDPGCDCPRCGPAHWGGISSFSIAIDEPVAWGPFKQWLEYLAMLKGEDLLRFKALVHVAEKPERPVVVHGVQHVFHPPRELDAWPSEDRRSRLVFVTRGIQRALIEATLSKFAAIDIVRIRRPAA